MTQETTKILNKNKGKTGLERRDWLVVGSNESQEQQPLRCITVWLWAVACDIHSSVSLMSVAVSP